jgi:hypothetical protein
MSDTKLSASSFSHKGASIEKILKDLYRQEIVLLHDADARTVQHITNTKTLQRLIILRKQQAKVVSKILELDVQVHSTLAHVDLEVPEGCQGQHDILLRYVMHRTDLDSEEETMIENLLVYLRLHLDRLMVRGSLLLVNIRKCMLQTLSMHYAYEPGNNESVNDSKIRHIRDVLEHGDAATCGLSMIVMRSAFTIAITHPNKDGFLDLPETFHFDVENMLKLNHVFEVQVLVVTTVFVLRKFQELLPACRPLTMTHAIEDVVTRIVAKLLIFKDIQMVVDITIDAFESFFRCDDTMRREVEICFLRGCALGSPLREDAFFKLGIIADAANSERYMNTFNTVPATVEVFKSLGIPLEAGCIAPLLHTQGQNTRGILKMHGDMHSKFYFPLVCDALITLYYEFP